MKSPSHILSTALALGLCLVGLSTARAASFTWSAPTNISADSNVLNAGLTVGAYRLGLTGLTAATVNGVIFQPFAVAQDFNGTATIGNFALTFADAIVSNTQFGSTVAPYGNLPAATQNFLQSGVAEGGVQTTLTISGLVIGQAYTFQWWSNNSGQFTGASGQRTSATTGTTSVVLNDNTNAPNSSVSGTAGGIGQFATGTFTADSATQNVVFGIANQDAPVLNAFQLRTVPEPSTWAMLLGGAGVFALVRFRKRKAASTFQN